MYEIYYQTKSGLRLVGKTDRVDTVAYCTAALNRQGWATEVYFIEAAKVA